jgi:hypothetical protein
MAMILIPAAYANSEARRIFHCNETALPKAPDNLFGRQHSI